MLHRLAMCWLFLVVVAMPSVGRSDWDDDFVRALRERRLYEIAERVCQSRLAAAETPREAAHWAVEGMRITAAAAIQLPSDEAGKRWIELEKRWVEPFLRQHASSPWRWQVSLQQALSVLAQGERLRRESEVVRPSEPLRDSALQRLRDAERLLRQLLKELSQPPPHDGSMPPSVVQGLQNQATLALAEVYWNRALCYAVGSDDRLAALESARRRLDSLVQQTRPEDLVQAKALLWRARCLRALGDFDGARAALQLLNRRKGLSADFQLQRDAEALRLAHAAHDQRLPFAPTIGRSIGGVHSPEWDMAALEIWLDRLALSSSDDAERVQRTIEQGIAIIETVHGPYYGRLATQLMIGRIRGATSAASAGLLERSARERLGEKRWREAADLLRQAAEAASRSGDAKAAFQYAYQAALVEQENGDHESAAQHFRDLSLRWRRDPRASQAHLMAIWELQRAVDSSDDPTVLAWLDEQLHVWPQDAATSRARVWLARWLRLKNKATEALDVLKQVDWTSEAAQDAIAEMFALWNARLEAASGQDVQPLRTELDNYVAAVLESFPDDVPAEVGRRLRRMHWQLRALVGEKLDARQQALLREWWNDKTGDPLDRTHAALVAILLSDDAIQLQAFSAWHRLPFDEIRWLVGAWRKWQEQYPQRARERAGLVAAAIDRWLDGVKSATPAQRLYLMIAAAEAIGVQGDRPEARRRFESLRSKYKDNTALRRAWAHFLLNGDSATDWVQAEQVWRTLGARAKPGSALWYECKYGVAKSLLLQGKQAECRQRLAYLRATRGFGPSPWRERLMELWQRCQ